MNYKKRTTKYKKELTEEDFFRKEEANTTKKEKKPYEKKKMPIKDYIFFLQSRRDYSYKEIYDKLIKREEDPEKIKEILDYMKKEGYQSDERMAASYYKSRKYKKGDKLIGIELRQKGISQEIINNTIKELKNEEENIENAFLIIYKFSKFDLTDRKIKEKALRKVVSKGFSFNEANKAWNKLIEENIEK